jgi:hypothetical protein
MIVKLIELAIAYAPVVQALVVWALLRDESINPLIALQLL